MRGQCRPMQLRRWRHSALVGGALLASLRRDISFYEPAFSVASSTLARGNSSSCWVAKMVRVLYKWDHHVPYVPFIPDWNVAHSLPQIPALTSPVLPQPRHSTPDLYPVLASVGYGSPGGYKLLSRGLSLNASPESGTACPVRRVEVKVLVPMLSTLTQAHPHTDWIKKKQIGYR
jgi:hypothetical protein